MLDTSPLALAQALIRCPSVTPEEGGALSFIAQVLGDAGFEVHRPVFSSEGTPDVENLYARFGVGHPHLVFAGHTDVVPPGDAARWRHDPFGGIVEGGELFGRGATDMKGGVACMMAAALAYLAEHPDFSGSIGFLITGDEEGPAVNGTVKLLDWAKAKGERFDHCILGEPTNPEALGDMIKIGRRGSLTGRLVVHGKQGHVAYPQLAENPIAGMVRLVAALKAEPLDGGTAHFDASNLEFTTLDVGNPATNVIPMEARATFNIRFNDRWSPDSLEAELRRPAARGRRKRGALHGELRSDERRCFPDRARQLRLPDRGDRGRDRPPPVALDDRRHLGCALHQESLPGGGVRARRPDDAPGRRAGRGRRSRPAGGDLPERSRALLFTGMCPRNSLTASTTKVEDDCCFGVTCPGLEGRTMIVTADDVTRSLRGTAALLNRRPDGLRSFDFSEAGFWHSFGAIVLTLPAFVVTLALERRRLGLALPGRSLVDDNGLLALVALAHVAAFLALPVAMVWIVRRLELQRRYVPFVIVTNWISVVGLTVLSVPALLLLLGWATPSLSVLFAIGFGAVMVRLQWFATKVTLGVSNGVAATIVALGLVLNLAIAAALQAFAA